MPEQTICQFNKNVNFMGAFFYESLSVVRFCSLFTLFYTFYDTEKILIDRIIDGKMFY